jgi:hypothetical protein
VLSLQVVPSAAGRWCVSADGRAGPAIDYARREDAEAAAAREIERRGGGKLFVFDAAGQLVKVIRVARQPAA